MTCLQQLVLQVPIEPSVKPTLGDELLVAAVFGDAATVEDQYTIRLFHRRQAMGNDQRRTPLKETIEALVQGILRRRIQRRGGFIENHDLRLGQDHACYGQALPLTAGQTHAGAADDAVQTVR